MVKKKFHRKEFLQQGRKHDERHSIVQVSIAATKKTSDKMTLKTEKTRDEFGPWLRYSIIFTLLTGGVTGLSISLQNCRTRKNLHSTRRIFQFNHWIQSIRDQYVRQVMKSANHPSRNHKYFQLKETKLISVTRHRRQGAQFGWAFHLILRS